MQNIFDVLPINFFNIFNGENKRVMSDCLNIVFNSFKNDLSFSSTKEQVLALFQDYFEGHLTTLESDEVLNNSRDQAVYILRRLRECGWISEEPGENYETFINFQDYAIKIMDTLFSLDNVSDVEYSGLVYNIYVSFNNFDVNKGDLVFETGFENTKILANKLKNLNSNIKKYIQNLLDKGIKDDLEALLTSLLQDYQTKIIDRAYYNLTTYDNPSKYRQRIINRIEKIINNENYLDTIVRNIMERKEIEYAEASTILLQQSDYIINAFEHIEDIMQEIDNKNNKFIESAINRITFLLNNQHDIEGKINQIIKALVAGQQVDELANIYLNAFIGKESLYIPRTYSKPLDINVQESKELDQSKIDQSVEQILKIKKYSRKHIEAEVMAKLHQEGSFLASSLPLDNNDDLATLVLIYLYGYSYQCKYAIEPLDKTVVNNNYRFQDYRIKEKING